MKKNPAPPQPKILFSIDEAADLLGLSPCTIRNWAYAGKIASHKIGRRLLVSQTSIDQVLSESLRPQLKSA